MSAGPPERGGSETPLSARAAARATRWTRGTSGTGPASGGWTTRATGWSFDEDVARCCGVPPVALAAIPVRPAGTLEAARPSDTARPSGTAQPSDTAGAPGTAGKPGGSGGVSRNIGASGGGTAGTSNAGATPGSGGTSSSADTDGAGGRPTDSGMDVAGDRGAEDGSTFAERVARLTGGTDLAGGREGGDGSCCSGSSARHTADVPPALCVGGVPPGDAVSPDGDGAPGCRPPSRESDLPVPPPPGLSFPGPSPPEPPLPESSRPGSTTGRRETGRPRPARRPAGRPPGPVPSVERVTDGVSMTRPRRGRSSRAGPIGTPRPRRPAAPSGDPTPDGAASMLAADGGGGFVAARATGMAGHPPASLP
ncbi:hypothetical protein Ga0074812_12946 [Parafrankia irregularis]|uniref:Uncharacterized protein n=1 Tax=Parafrankia irregularis TaxID=795642 RepID=A0A0S4QXT5_9ACTN|nr:hypothetical protein Ga0074812_12946 [Parafrankia irregularis]